MAKATIKSKKGSGKPTYLSMNDKSNFRVIKLNSDGKLYVEHKILADKLIKRKLAEPSQVDFDLKKKTITKMSDVEK